MCRSIGYECGRLKTFPLTGFGCDEKKVIEILAHRTQIQRVAIADAYYGQYGESIHKRLKSELHGKLEVHLLQTLTFKRDFFTT